MADTMRAAVYYGAGDVRIEDREKPSPGPGEVLLRVTRTGMCGTDGSEWKSGPKTFPIRKRHPHSGHQGPLILGHEFIGVVEESCVAEFSPGDRVASGAGVSCGTCERCEEGRTNLCRRYRTYGLNAPGGMAQFAVVDGRTLVAIPEDLSDDFAGLAQPLAVGLHAARRSGARRGDRIILIGAGAIGTFLLAALKHLTGAEVVVVDFPGTRLERALRVGADGVVEVGSADFELRMSELSGTSDLVIEASGAAGQLNRAIALARDGGTVLQVGVPTGDQAVDIHQLVFREIDVRTTLAHVCAEDMPESIEILRTTNLGPELLDSVRPLEELPEQLDRLVAGGLEGKVLFDPFS